MNRRGLNSSPIGLGGETMVLLAVLALLGCVLLAVAADVAGA